MVKEEIEIDCIFPLLPRDHSKELHSCELFEVRYTESAEDMGISLYADFLIRIESTEKVYDTHPYSSYAHMYLILSLELCTCESLFVTL